MKQLENASAKFHISQLEAIKEMFVLYDDFGKLTLKNISSMHVGKNGSYLLINEKTGENFEYTSSIDSDTYNKIKLTYDNEDTGKREVYIAKDTSRSCSCDRYSSVNYKRIVQ